MTSNHAQELLLEVIQNDPTKAAPLLRLLSAIVDARGDPLGEAMISDVLFLAYSKTEHCEKSMREFISEKQVDQAQLVA